MVEEGGRIAADRQLIRGHDLYVDEASLTGENLGMAKASDALRARNCARGTARHALHGHVGSERPQPFRRQPRPGCARRSAASQRPMQGAEERSTPLKARGRPALTTSCHRHRPRTDRDHRCASSLTVSRHEPLETFVTAILAPRGSRPLPERTAGGVDVGPGVSNAYACSSAKLSSVRSPVS